jgi:hypothetical protein
MNALCISTRWDPLRAARAWSVPLQAIERDPRVWRQALEGGQVVYNEDRQAVQVPDCAGGGGLVGHFQISDRMAEQLGMLLADLR